MKQILKVAYILHRFPYLTETFIMREMYWIRKKAVDITIFSLLPPKHTLVHEEARVLLPNTFYCPFLSWKVITAQLYFLWRSPSRYLCALAKLIWQTYREPKVLLRALALFPKSVYFARQMETLEIDHIHAHFAWLEGIAAGVAVDLLGITHSIHPHAFGLFGRNQRDVCCELENASQIVTISSYHRAYIAEMCPRVGPNDVEIVHYGLDTNYFQPALTQPDGHSILVLSVGRLIEKKGHEYLIDACALLVERELEFQCEIVGGGRRERLQAHINRLGLQDRVTLRGALKQDEILELYQRSDIFALACTLARSGDQDGMPNVLIEAMACAVPVVTTPISGIPDLVQDGETGLLVKEGDVLSLADALERLIVDERLRRQLGRQARQRILQKFQIQHTVAKLAKIFRRVSQRRQKTLINAVAAESARE